MTGSSIASRLQQARFKARLSRPALAELAGVSAETIFNAEKGLHVPRGQTIYALADALGVSPEYLLEGTEAA